ncbi:hypothetical protein CV_4050 [Chromobacterium violaceum ATCC 12472]|uniref:Uncharacterized protein n=1 Tax=Chromobacterium violaceum (strain ATCC 12472 / DSM 30191 / JCM 1249 / CCUG 213 / NBRC 12614 / NCIMB 9131 / NCTC 9757 / MK) TaxID=243365 RepID=Q7NQT7_CHRVO|nr:hypothetical protein CV_4050 [Chromobacterium violaceum ATCC 12472]
MPDNQTLTPCKSCICHAHFITMPKFQGNCEQISANCPDFRQASAVFYFTAAANRAILLRFALKPSFA